MWCAFFVGERFLISCVAKQFSFSFTRFSSTSSSLEYHFCFVEEEDEAFWGHMCALIFLRFRFHWYPSLHAPRERISSMVLPFFLCYFIYICRRDPFSVKVSELKSKQQQVHWSCSWMCRRWEFFVLHRTTPILSDFARTPIPCIVLICIRTGMGNVIYTVKTSFRLAWCAD